MYITRDGLTILEFILQVYEKRSAYYQKTVACPLPMLDNLKMRHSLERRDWVVSLFALGIVCLKLLKVNFIT